MTENTDNNLMQSQDKLPMHASPRCNAHSKRTGLPCNNPAVKGWKVCRMHGAGGGAPTGKRNGNYRHGMRTKQAMAERAVVELLARLGRQN